MGEQVSVESFEALSCLRTALSKFVDSAATALYAADADLYRIKNWVKTDQAKYWKMEGRKRAELLIRAQLALKAKRNERSPLGARQSTDEEEKAVKLATRRVEEAEQKAAAVRHWSRRIDEEAAAYHTWASGMKQACMIDVPSAITKLDNMLAALEAYAAQGPQLQGSVASSTWEPDAAAPADYESMSRGTPQAAHDENAVHQPSDPPLGQSDQRDGERESP